MFVVVVVLHDSLSFNFHYYFHSINIQRFYLLFFSVCYISIINLHARLFFAAVLLLLLFAIVKPLIDILPLFFYLHFFSLLLLLCVYSFIVFFSSIFDEGAFYLIWLLFKTFLNQFCFEWGSLLSVSCAF